MQAAVAKACAKPKAGATVSEKSAKYLCPPLPVIGGYACFNDDSIRDWQRKSDDQFTLGKNFDGTGGFGPMS